MEDILSLALMALTLLFRFLCVAGRLKRQCRSSAARWNYARLC